MRRPADPQRQQGVVLIIALIMLVVVSMLATLGIRNATSSESISGNVRTTALASQAAEIALRYCEDLTVAVERTTPAPIAAPAGFNILDTCPTANAACTAPKGVTPANWDKVTTDVYVVPATSVNGGSVTFKREPECMVERTRIATTSAPFYSTTSTYVITARGFGPEIPSVTDVPRTTRPQGSEVWLQSTIERN